MAGASGEADNVQNTDPVWAPKSTALAGENLMLALRALGFDSCPLKGIDTTRIRKLLPLPRAAEVCLAVSAANIFLEKGPWRGERLNRS